MLKTLRGRVFKFFINLKELAGGVARKICSHDQQIVEQVSASVDGTITTIHHRCLLCDHPITKLAPGPLAMLN